MNAGLLSSMAVVFSMVLGLSMSQTFYRCDIIVFPADLHLAETDLPGTLIFKLPISADVNLTFVVSEPAAMAGLLGHYFRLYRDNDQYKLANTKILDIEKFYADHAFMVKSVTLSINCNSIADSQTGKNVTIEIDAIDEYSPTCKSSTTVVTEEYPPGSSITQLYNACFDKDRNTNRTDGDDIKGYELVPYTPEAKNAQRLVTITTQRGVLKVGARIDREAGNDFYYLNVSAIDYGGLRGYVVIKLQVLDIDDQPPEFYSPGCPRPCPNIAYRAIIPPTHMGPITEVRPYPVAVRDGDTLNYPINLTIKASSNPSGFFEIDSNGVVSVVRSIYTDASSQLLLVLEATEQSLDKRSTETSFMIIVLRETNPVFEVKTNQTGSSSENVSDTDLRPTSPTPSSEPFTSSKTFFILVITLPLALLMTGCAYMQWSNYQVRKSIAAIRDRPDPSQLPLNFRRSDPQVVQWLATQASRQQSEYPNELIISSQKGLSSNTSAEGTQDRARRASRQDRRRSSRYKTGLPIQSYSLSENK